MVIDRTAKVLWIFCSSMLLLLTVAFALGWVLLSRRGGLPLEWHFVLVLSLVVVLEVVVIGLTVRAPVYNYTCPVCGQDVRETGEPMAWVKGDPQMVCASHWDEWAAALS